MYPPPSAPPATITQVEVEVVGWMTSSAWAWDLMPRQRETSPLSTNNLFPFLHISPKAPCSPLTNGCEERIL